MDEQRKIVEELCAAKLNENYEEKAAEESPKQDNK
jgi:hypothetical protein